MVLSHRSYSQINRIGAALWLAGAALFLVLNALTQLAWHTPYSLRNNNISDLGNRFCEYSGADNPPRRYICSPWHAPFDASMVACGVLIIIGVGLTGALWRQNVRARVARTLLLSGGSGYLLAGLWPADVDLNLHVLGAALIMGFGNLGLLLATFSVHRPLRIPTAVLGVAAFVGTGLHFGDGHLGLGLGGSERIAVFALQAWLILAGVYLLRTHPGDTATTPQPVPTDHR